MCCLSTLLRCILVSVMNSAKLSIVVGSYEQLLLCYELLPGNDKLTAVFGDKTQTGCIRDVKISNNHKYLASASSDETLRIISWKKRRQLGTIESHSAPVLTICFVGYGMLLSGGADGRICLYQCSSWDIIHEWRDAHKCSVLSLACHPSTKLALSLGSDSTLRLWDLQTKKKAFSLKLEASGLQGRAQEVVWSSEGASYVITHEFQVQMFDASDCSLASKYPSDDELSKMSHSARLSSRVTCPVLFLENNQLLCGHENGRLSLISMSSLDAQLVSFKVCHERRIKAISLVQCAVFALVTCCSNGEIVIWRADSAQVDVALLRVFSKLDTNVRITCLAIDGLWDGGICKPPNTTPLSSESTTTCCSISKVPKKRRKRKIKPKPDPSGSEEAEGAQLEDARLANKSSKRKRLI